jgi:hypothetical protein
LFVRKRVCGGALYQGCPARAPNDILSRELGGLGQAPNRGRRRERAGSADQPSRDQRYAPFGERERQHGETAEGTPGEHETAALGRRKLRDAPSVADGLQGVNPRAEAEEDDVEAAPKPIARVTWKPSHE